MKKIFMLLIAVLLVVFAGGCGNSADDGNADDNYSVDKINAEVSPAKEPEKVIDIKAVGDIMLGRNVQVKLNYDYPLAFEQVKDILNDADITFGNLECTLSDRGEKLIGKGAWLRAQPQAVDALKYAGIDIVSIANNHILDYNSPALKQTISILDENNIKHVGAGDNITEARKPVILEQNGIKIGFLAYSDLYQYGYKVDGQTGYRTLEATDKQSGIAPLKEDIIISDIATLRPEVDLLFVSLHWGVEESFNIPLKQRELGHNIIDAGADMILGHHPHQLQGTEIYNGKPIIYSMGNFIFDQNDDENKDSIIVSAKYVNGKITHLSQMPVRIVDKRQAVPVYGDDATKLLSYLLQMSKDVGSDCKIENDVLVYSLE